MRYVLLFRGINVGGKNTVKMADLSRALTEAGFTDVTCYLQSGNALVSAPEAHPADVAAHARAVFEKSFGFAAGVVALTREELRRAVAEMPFQAEALARAQAEDPAVDHLYLYFLSAPPDMAALAKLTAGTASGDQVVVGERTLYLLCGQSVRKSKMGARIARGFPAATARNWNTARQLDAMLAEG